MSRVFSLAMPSSPTPLAARALAMGLLLLAGACAGKDDEPIAAYDDAGTLGQHCKDCRLLGLLPVISLHSSGPNGTGARFSDEVYGTTIHELAHASHWEFRRNNWNFNLTEARLQESWAEGVEWIFARLRYGSYGDRPDRTNGYQGRLLTVPNYLTYTPIAVDLFDSRDQSIGC